MTFDLNEKLAQDSLFVYDLPLCQVRIINDCNYPWCLLVPRISGITELTELNEKQYQNLWLESRQLSLAMQWLFKPQKMNVATLGNQVPQLHIHHIARFDTDSAWPNPIWGAMPMQAYDDDVLQARIADLRAVLEKPV